MTSKEEMSRKLIEAIRRVDRRDAQIAEVATLSFQFGMVATGSAVPEPAEPKKTA